MTPDEAYLLSKFQLPGFRIIVGPEVASVVKIEPLEPMTLFRMPGDACWHHRDLRTRFGFLPSLIASEYIVAADLLGHETTAKEAEWLHGPASKQEMEDWIARIFQERVQLASTPTHNEPKNTTKTKSGEVK